MHIRRKLSQNHNDIYREQKSTEETRTPQDGKLWKEDTWRRFRQSVAKVLQCKTKRSRKNNVPYASLTGLDRLSFGENELKKNQKKLRFCLKRVEQERDTFDYEQCEERDEEECDSILVERRESFERRRMAICKEIERNTKVGYRSRSTSLLELRKTLVINNRFKEMGL